MYHDGQWDFQCFKNQMKSQGTYIFKKVNNIQVRKPKTHSETTNIITEVKNAPQGLMSEFLQTKANSVTFKTE